MSEHQPEVAATTEVVGRFADRAGFAAAVNRLMAAGFERGDLSVLDSHDSLSAAETRDETWREKLAGLTGEVVYVGPLTAAGLILLAAGPIAAAAAAVVGAGLAGVATRELLDELQATPHTTAFARALEQGAVLLWVRAETPEAQQQAAAILQEAGGMEVHVHRRVGGRRVAGRPVVPI